jgi:PAS domain S-box-containing protein
VNARHDSQDLDQSSLAAWPCGLARTRIDGTILWCNPYFLELVGATAEDVIGRKRVADLLTVPGKIYYETHFLPQLRLQGFVYEMAVDMAGSGRSIPILLNAVIFRSDPGESEELRIAVFKAQERRRYEQELLQARRNAEYLAEVFRYSEDAIMTMSPDGRVKSWNEGAVRIFGYSSVEAVGRSIGELIVPEDEIEEFREARERMSTGQRVRFETVCSNREGRRMDVSVALTPHLEPPGIMAAYSAVIRDETERKKATEALMRSEKIASVGRLASSIAHEINNPLEAVTNLLYLVGCAEELAPATRQFLGMAQDELTRVNYIATHTLRFHRQSSRATPTDVAALLDSVLTLYTARIRNTQVEVERSYNPVQPLIAFESELRQVFANLIGNAVDAMQASPLRRLLLRVSTARSTGGTSGLRVTVADTGMGMSPSSRQHLFEPFFSTKGINGTGLGLWVSKEILDRHHAYVQVKSREGEGTVFSLFLPYLTHVEERSQS